MTEQLTEVGMLTERDKQDLAELRPCYSVDGLTKFIAKHFPRMELRERQECRHERTQGHMSSDGTGKTWCQQCGFVLFERTKTAELAGVDDSALKAWMT